MTYCRRNKIIKNLQMGVISGQLFQVEGFVHNSKEVKTQMLKIGTKKFLSLFLCFVMLAGLLPSVCAVSEVYPVVKDINTDKAMYSPGDVAEITVTLENGHSTQWSGQVYIEISHLETSVATLAFAGNVPANGTATLSTMWTVPATDFTGYLLRAYTDGSTYAVTALDCSSDFTVYPRYGYISDYSTDLSAADVDSMVSELASRYHINAYQLYDWMWRHETLIKRENGSVSNTWQDLFGRTIGWQTVKNYIDSIHDINGNAMAYVMSYAAREGYDNFGVDASTGLYTDTNHSSQLNVDFGDGSTYLWLFDPSNTEWQSFMTAQYVDAINTAGFDGLQIDQMGQRNNIYDYRGQKVYLEDTFSSLINAAKAALTDNDPDKDAVTFNIVDGTVDGWALEDIAEHSDTDFSFSEIWWLSDSYNDIKNYVEQVRTVTDGKALVLAAYMNYKDNCGPLYEAENAVLNGVSTNTDHTGYTGSGFVDGFSNVGDCVTFTINAPEDGLYSFVFRYANSTGSGANRKVYVDNVILDEVSFGNMGDWDTWAFDANCSAYLTAGSHTVRLSYDNGCSGAINLDSLTLGTFDENSIRLANAAFAASGAFHIELGAGEGQPTMLSNEYYPMNAKAMRSSLQDAMEDHYNFITAYENLLFDADISYGDTGTQYVSISGESVSGSGEQGKIWYVTRQNESYQILHLINLTGENDTDWRNATSTPTTKNNLSVKYYISPNASVSGVYFASPDVNGGITSSLQYSLGNDSNGSYVTFTVPSLEYWDMIYIRREENSSVTTYEAEDALKTNVSVNNDHSGYSGNGFVDGFESYGDSIGFMVNVGTADTYTLYFRYANGSNAEATRAVIVDGKYVNTAHFLAQGNWDTWAITEVGVELKAGIHSVVVYYGDYESGAINLDYLKIAPLSISARSLYMNNWKNAVAVWQDTNINQITPVNNSGPGLYELRYYDGQTGSDYNTDLINNYSAFLRDVNTGVTYTDGSKFSSTGYFDEGGVLINIYDSYGGDILPVEMTKSYAFVPNQQFIIVQYDLKNTSSSSKTVSVLDMLHVNNPTSGNISAAYNSGTQATVIDMSAAGLQFIAHGSLNPNETISYQVANDAVSDVAATTCSPWHTFNSNGTLNSNSSVTCQDISSGFMGTVTIPAQGSKTLYFYLAIADTASELSALISTVRQTSGASWMSLTRSEYSDWLEEGKESTLDDAELNDAYNSISVFMKQSIVPGTSSDGTVKFAAFPATTNPSNYSYKVWARDSAVTAMSLDATGHLSEAENYWYWLADRQIVQDQGDWKKPGTFWTCYWIWDNSPVSFVEPEFDSIGMFLVGAYKHYTMLSGSAKANFLNNIWDAYRRSADYVLNNITSAGFGPADCSIWEEQSEYNTFTQALYVAGLDAAQYMAQAKGLQSVADMYNGGASTIRTAILRDDTDSTAGLWNTSSQRFNRAVNLDGTANTLYDSSSDVLISYGVVDARSSRAKSHIDGIISVIGHDKYGVARYEHDGFYHRMPWDPGGNEALEDEPSWPQMAMWIAMYELQSGYESYRATAYERLKWFVSRTADGYMPQGECFSNVTLKPHISTMCEPITGAAYLMTVMAYCGEFDMRVWSPQVNAGAFSEITMTAGCSGDWSQWVNIPYYTDPAGDGSSVGNYTYDLSRVYIANDYDNIYIRLDFEDWALPGYQESDVFAVQVYADASGAVQSNSTSYAGQAMIHPMSYMTMRASDSASNVLYTATSSGWSSAGTVLSVIEPQWEPSSGRIELAVPYSAIGNASPSAGDWTNMRVVILAKSGSNWIECDCFDVHYRMTVGGMEWLKGNFQ